VVSEDHLDTVRKLKTILSTYTEAEDLIRIGAYVRGTSPAIDRAIDLIPECNSFLRQRINERDTLDSALQKLRRVTDRWPF